MVTSDRGPLTPEGPPLLALSDAVTHPLDRSADALGDVLERLVLVRPCRHGPQVNRESLDPEERGTHPVNRTARDRDHRRLLCHGDQEPAWFQCRSSTQRRETKD